MSKPRNSRPLAGLGTALTMSTGLLALSFIRAADGGPVGWTASGGVIQSVLVDGIWGTRLGYELTLFAIVIVLLHVGFGLACWLLGRMTMHVPRLAGTASIRQCTAVWCILLCVWLIAANAAWLPNSALGKPYSAAVTTAWHGVSVFNAVSTVVIAAIVAVATAAARKLPRPTASRAWAVIAVGAIAVALPATLIVRAHAGANPVASRDRPHIIVIGIDSLRCDIVSRPGGGWTPTIDRFLAQSAAFTDALTPLARTYPSWTAILTGRHPHTTGAVINLVPRSTVRTGDTLGDMARRAGYRSVYAIDEVRFSNIDETFGFDQAITPPIGATDFVVGMVGDIPLVNIFVNARLGRWLLPQLHANRAAYKTYDPDTFVERLDRELSFDRPTLLALHLTLVHWPYAWAHSSPPGHGTMLMAYGEAVRRVDRQFADVMAMLERRGALRNAIVVLLSDHGEALNRPGDTLVSPESVPGIEFPELQPAVGHGTSVLSPHQYRTVLAVRAFGNPLQAGLEGRKIDAPASLEDVTPTLAELAGFHPLDRFDGVSLAGLLLGRQGAGQAAADRIRFTESGFNPRGVSPAEPTISPDALRDAAHFYRVDPASNRLELRPAAVDILLQNRQYAAIRGDTLLAAIPGRLAAGYHYLVVNVRGGLPRRLDGPPDPGRDPDLAVLWDGLHARFAAELGPAHSPAIGPAPGAVAAAGDTHLTR